MASHQNGAPQAEELVSFLQLKGIYSKLPEGSMLRRLVLAEPDFLPRELAKEKAFLYLEMLEGEGIRAKR